MYKKMFHAMLDNHDAMMVLLDPNTGQIMDSNPAALRFYGYTATQFHSMNINELSVLVPLDMAKLQAGRTHFMLPHRLASGEIRTVEMYVSTITWPENPMFFAIIHDITERTRAEVALRESEQKLQTLLELLPIGVSVLNTENKIAYMNPAVEKILQISSEDLLQGDYRQRRYIHPDGSPMKPSDFASSRALREQQAIYDIETGIITEDNQTIWTNVSAIPINCADWRVLVVTSDITERKRLAEEVQAQKEQQHLQIMRQVFNEQQRELVLRTKEEEKLLHELFEAIPVPIFYKDPQGKYLACNQAFVTFSEKPKAEIIGQTAFEITSHEYAQKYYAADMALMANPQVQTSEYNVYRLNTQEQLTFLMTKSVIKNVSGQVTGLVGVITDITHQKRLEAALQERLDFFQEMYEKHNAIMLLIDPDSGQIIQSNQAAREFYGYSVAEFKGMNIQEINILPSTEIQQERQRALHEERNYFIFPHRLASGEVRTVEVHSSPIMWKNQRVLFSIIHDITQRQRLEEALRESEAKFRSYVDNSPDGIFVVNEKGDYLEVNHAAALITGYDEAELLQMNIANLLPPDALESGLNHFKAVQSTGYATGEFMFVHHNGQKRWWSVDAVKLMETRYLGFVKDITGRKQAEAALRDSEERWQYALEGSGDGVWDWNAQTNQVYFSRRWKEMLGYAEHEIGNDVSEWDKRIHLDDKAPTYEKLNAHFRGETPYYLSEHRLLHKDGSYRWILDRGKVMSWVEETKPLRVVGTHTDITERKLMEHALQLSEARHRVLEGELRELNGQKDRFLAIIAHDLRSPFSAILGLSNYLSETWERIEKTDLKIVAEAIQTSAQNLYKLLDNLLTWSQIQRNSVAFEPMNLNIAEVAQETLALLALNASSKEIRLHNLSHSEHQVYGDYNMVNTIMRNLLSNALKFTPRGGQITLSTEVIPDFIKVSVTDTGIGITSENQAKLFQLDNRYKRPGTEDEPGTGLGLLLCQQLVQKNGGEIGVKSVLGQGSTFYFTLPQTSGI